MNDTPRDSSAPETRGDTTVVSAVLLYHLDGSTVTASLLSPIDGSDLGVAESIDLEDFSPEQIGLTVPMLWDLVDVADACVMSVVTSGAAADIDVAPPILELAFGVPVFDSPTPVVADTPAAGATLDDDATPPADDVAPWQRTTPSAVAAAAAAARPPLRPTRPVPAKPVRRSATGAGKSGVVKSGASASPISKSAAARAGVAGAAAAAARPRVASADEVTPVDKAVPPTTSSDTDTEVFPAVVAPAVVDPIDDARTEAIPVVTAASVAPTGRRSRRFVGFAGAAAAAALVAAGIGTAAVMSGGSDSVPQNTAAEQQAPNGGSASPVADAPAVAAPVVPAAPAASPAPAAPAAPVPTEDAAADAAASDWTAPSAAPWSPTAAAPAPTPWTTTPPQQQSSSPSAVPAPQFTVPVPEQDPNKSPQQLQDEAWAKHWQQTGQWLNQEFPQ
ncbi:hypothetical protein [Rhodococcus sp. NBC_00294]|uniref:hypothetical protein n=1 Tax=Rhodococcus sp. NBC_00294 TaxID=2976004 RepID=UPI002E2D972D|nr:hypothetical protein [Rhodococcus sp. NBC_00294]